MTAQKSSEQFSVLFELAVQLAKASDTDALLLMVEKPIDWEDAKKQAGRRKRGDERSWSRAIAPIRWKVRTRPNSTRCY
jgi:hypothetical protein